jgi:chromosome segregation ATPase
MTDTKASRATSSTAERRRRILRVHRKLVERRLSHVHMRLRRAREELAVLDEQLSVVGDAAEEARIRALVSETPLADREFKDARRQVEALAAGRAEVARSIAELEAAQDALLDRLSPRP